METLFIKKEIYKVKIAAKTDNVIQHIKISNDDKLKEVRVSLYNHIDAFGSHVKQKYLELI